MASRVSKSDLSAQITSSGIEEQINLLKKMPVAMTDDLKKVMKEANAIMRKDEKPRVSVFTGSTKKSVRGSVKSKFVGSVTGITGPSKKQLFFFRMMQDGRAPGARMPNIERLIPWVEKKFGTEGNASRQMAFRVAKSIQQHGTKGTQIARPVMEKNKGKVLHMLQGVITKIVDAMIVRSNG